MKQLSFMILIFFSNLCWSVYGCIPSHTLNNVGDEPEVRIWLIKTKITAENKIHTIYYVHAKSAKLEERQGTVTCLIELWTYLINTKRESRNTPIVRILRETYDRETTEFVSLFPNVERRQTYNPVQRLYRITTLEELKYLHDIEERQNINQIQPKSGELNETDVWLLEKGFELLLFYNEIETLTGTSTNVNYEEAVLTKKIQTAKNLRNFIAFSGNMKIENSDAVSKYLDIYNRLCEDEYVPAKRYSGYESKQLFTYSNGEYTEIPILDCALYSKRIAKKSQRFYVLRKTDVKETFLYIQHNQSLTLVEEFLKFGETFADNACELVYVVQKVNLFPPFIVAFRDFISMFFSQDSLVNIMENIKNALP